MCIAKAIRERAEFIELEKCAETHLRSTGGFYGSAVDYYSEEYIFRYTPCVSREVMISTSTAFLVQIWTGHASMMCIICVCCNKGSEEHLSLWILRKFLWFLR